MVFTKQLLINHEHTALDFCLNYAADPSPMQIFESPTLREIL